MKSKNLSFFAAAKFIMQFMKDMKLQYFLFYIGWLFHTVVVVITPIIFGVMINQIVYYNNIDIFMQVGLVFLYVTIFGVILYYLVYEMYAYLWNGINRRLRIGMFRHLQKLSATEFVQLNHGETVNMIKFWSIEAVNFMIRNIVHNINNLLKILACIIIIFVINPLFGLITIILVPMSVAVSLKIGKRIRDNSNKNRDEYGKYIGWLFEVIYGLSDIRLLGAEDAICRKLDKKQTGINKLNEKIALENSLGSELLANIKNIILLVQYLFLAYFAINEHLSIGTILVLLTFFNTLSSSLSQVATSYMDAQFRISLIEKMKEFFGKETIIIENEQKECLNEQIETIEFADCSFAYGDNKVLENINFSVKKGEKLAIVGCSGSGKTTLLNLILAIYKPQNGKLLINGKDLSDFDAESYYDHISAVFQQVILLEGTIADNLQMGETVSMDKMVEVCKAAGIYDEICALENAFNTQVELGGNNFSGGQKQRIGIARAYMKNSDVIIMDEATSALDTDNEAKILSNLDEILKGRICIVVSHRPNTVMNCDRVIMLKDGKICACGTPEEMMNNRDFMELFALEGKAGEQREEK